MGNPEVAYSAARGSSAHQDVARDGGARRDGQSGIARIIERT